MANKRVSQLPLNTNPSLSGVTIYDDGQVTYSVKIEDLVSSRLALTGGTISGGLTANTISATTYLNLPSVYLPLSGGTVTGDTIFQSGLTANTISATTYLNLPVVESFSRTIEICDTYLIGTGTTEQKIIDYLEFIDYKKSLYDGDVIVIVNDCEPIEISLDVTIYSGSVITVFNHTLSYEIPQDVSLPVELQLGLTNGGTFNIPVTIEIEKNTLSGSTTVTSTEINYGDLSGTSNLLVGQLSLNYGYEVPSPNITFDIPIDKGSGIGDLWMNGIGLSLLD